MITRRLLLAAVAPVLLPGITLAEDEPPEEEPPVFDRLFPHPTGANGFEDIIRAAERLKEIQNDYYPPSREFTLTKKREYLAHPICREASSLLRLGLSKTITIPNLDPFRDDQFLPFAPMRTLSRLFAVEIYVCFADGRTDVAVRTLAEGLTLAKPLKSMSVLAGLVARAMDAIVLAPVVRQRESWSVRDAKYLFRLAEQCLAVPDPAIATLAVEHANALRRLERWRTNPETLYADLEAAYPVSEDDEPESPIQRQAFDYARRVQGDTALRERILREMGEAIAYYFDQASVLMNDPTGPMVLTPPPGADRGKHPILPFLRNAFLLNARSTVPRSIEGRVNLQLLAVHATIRGFRWENDRLPKSLEELELPQTLVIDPFTKKPLLYEPAKAGTNYDLASAGALYPGEGGQPAARERVTLPWTPPKQPAP